ncbi:MAG: putative tRNA N6-adenosine threonylcarbamoyltransferase, mitochondrial [Marteilia pararefringens]
MRAHALIARMARFDERRVVNLGFPYLTLLLSGGHSLICLVRSARDFSVIGHNVGWATAGNTLDRCVKYLDLYVKDLGGDSKCGGQIAESLARSFYRKSNDNRIAERFVFNAKDRHSSQLTCNFDFFAFYKWFTQLDLKSYNSSGVGGEDSIGEAFAGLQQSLMQYVWRKLLRAIYYCVEVLKLSDFKNIVIASLNLSISGM